MKYKIGDLVKLDVDKLKIMYSKEYKYHDHDLDLKPIMWKVRSFGSWHYHCFDCPESCGERSKVRLCYILTCAGNMKGEARHYFCDKLMIEPTEQDMFLYYTHGIVAD